MKNITLDDGLTYRFMKSMEAEPHLSQSALSRSLGISLGKVNYCIKSLIVKGWVKAQNFHESEHKIGYAYILTPHGIEEKAQSGGKLLAYATVATITIGLAVVAGLLWLGYAQWLGLTSAIIVFSV